jgi:hypothetical protein
MQTFVPKQVRLEANILPTDTEAHRCQCSTRRTESSVTVSYKTPCQKVHESTNHVVF